jgi:hypothetical protein
VSRNYVWPFFGHTLRTAPYKYEETRYLWPFFLQARGDQRLRNRWAPFYSRSEIKGVSKTWVAWPLWRRETFTEAGLDQRKTQFLYVIYWNLEQRRPGQSPDAPVARKTHLWPLFSSWNNGAGQRQIQFLSPLEVFMQSNDTVRQAYTPLFALYRFNQPKPGDLRHSLLWNAISYERSQSAQRRAFHFGPLFSSSSAPEEKRIAFLAGLLAFNKGDALSSWKIKFFDFKKKADKTAASSP